MLSSAPRDLLVVGVDRFPALGSYVRGQGRDEEEDDHEPHGGGSLDAGQESFAEGEVEGRREDEGRGSDQNPVQAMPGGRLVACGYSTEVEREGGGEGEQDEREGFRSATRPADEGR